MSALSEPMRFWLAVQARARVIDRDQALLGALGVGADPLPHQIANVRRMLTQPGGRWLLADEVGMGKTIQAIMLMRALAAQSARRLTVGLVVPDDLVLQWEGELLTRGHLPALEQSAESAAEDDGVDEDPRIRLRLFRPSRFGVADAERLQGVDMLIVDEYPRLTVQVREEVQRAARDAAYVLILTATPALHDPAVKADLLALIEPEAARTALAETRGVLDVLGARELSGVQALASDDWSAWSALPPDTDRHEATRSACGLYRRLLRTRRQDYPDLLPDRVYAPITVAPTDGDIVRAEAARAAVVAAREADLEVRTDRLLQVAGRSPRALDTRLRDVSNKDRAIRDALVEHRARVSRHSGDARLDALLDELLSRRRDDSHHRALVVAEDNPTVEYLAEAIRSALDVPVVELARTRGINDSLEVQAAKQRVLIQPFLEGTAPVLVAADVAKEGFNLQSADQILFYALPWFPQDVEQWIGRIDRLGGPVVKGRIRGVEVTPLIVRGSLEERIGTVLQASGVFERTAIYDGGTWDELRAEIEAEGYGDAAANWSGLAKRAQAVARDRDADLLTDTAFPPPYNASAARDDYDHLSRRAYAGPRISQRHKPNDWFDAREGAVAGLLAVLRAAEVLDIRSNKHDIEQTWVRFRTLWYFRKPRPEDVVFPELDGRNVGHLQNVLTHRSHMSRPPTLQVRHHESHQPRRLRLLDHGDALHDSIVDRLDQWPVHASTMEHLVQFPVGHPVLAWRGRPILALVATLDPASLFDPTSLAAPPKSSYRSGSEQLAANRAAIIQLRDLEADRRWLLDLCPPVLLRAGVLLDGASPRLIDEPDVLFDPLAADVVARYVRSGHPSAPTALAGMRTLGTARLAQNAERCTSAAAQVLGEALPLRLFLLAAERNDRVVAAEAELVQARARTGPREIVQAGVRAAEFTVEATWRDGEARLQRLHALPAQLAAIRPHRLGDLLFKAGPLPE